MSKNKKIIRSASDLLDLVNENNDIFYKEFRKLSRKNRRLGVVSVVAVIIAFYTATECRKQDEELYKLSIRIQKLENKEGE